MSFVTSNYVRKQESDSTFGWFYDWMHLDLVTLKIETLFDNIFH